MNLAAASALFAQIDRPVWLVTACSGARSGGLVATFVCEASIVEELPRVAIGLARQHYTWELVEASGAFAIHLLGEEHLSWVWRFGLQSSREADKFAGLATRPGATGSPILSDALGWLDCRVEARLNIGDRTLDVAEVVQAQLTRPGTPLTQKRLGQLAPADKLQELKDQLHRDSTVDAAAIRSWRQGPNRGAPTSS